MQQNDKIFTIGSREESPRFKYQNEMIHEDQIQSILDQNYRKQCTLQYVIGIYKLSSVFTTYKYYVNQKSLVFQLFKDHYQYEQLEYTQKYIDSQRQLNNQIGQINVQNLKQEVFQLQQNIQIQQQDYEQRIQSIIDQKSQEIHNFRTKNNLLNEQLKQIEKQNNDLKVHKNSGKLERNQVNYDNFHSINQTNIDKLKQQSQQLRSMNSDHQQRVLRRLMQIFNIKQKTIYVLAFYRMINNILIKIVRPQLKHYDDRSYQDQLTILDREKEIKQIKGIFIIKGIFTRSINRIFKQIEQYFYKKDKLNLVTFHNQQLQEIQERQNEFIIESKQVSAQIEYKLQIVEKNFIKK